MKTTTELIEGLSLAIAANLEEAKPGTGGSDGVANRHTVALTILNLVKARSILIEEAGWEDVAREREAARHVTPEDAVIPLHWHAAPGGLALSGNRGLVAKVLRGGGNFVSLVSTYGLGGVERQHATQGKAIARVVEWAEGFDDQTVQECPAYLRAAALAEIDE